VFEKIVVGTDGSDTAALAVEQAAELARRFGATLHVVSAFPPSVRDPLPDDGGEQTSTHAEEVVGAAVEALRAAGTKVEGHPEMGDPAEVVIEVAERLDADLVVVGNRGMTGIKRFLLGSVPTKVSAYAPCDVLIVKTTP